MATAVPSDNFDIPDPGSPDPSVLQRRVDQLRLADRSLSEQEALDLAGRSDFFLAELEREGIVDVDLHLRHEINEIPVTDEELREYYEAHQPRFGDRTFEESRGALEGMVRVRKVREQREGASHVGDHQGGEQP